MITIVKLIFFYLTKKLHFKFYRYISLFGWEVWRFFFNEKHSCIFEKTIPHLPPKHTLKFYRYSVKKM
jgi:hypothetical protein